MQNVWHYEAVSCQRNVIILCFSCATLWSILYFFFTQSLQIIFAKLSWVSHQSFFKNTLLLNTKILLIITNFFFPLTPFWWQYYTAKMDVNQVKCQKTAKNWYTFSTCNPHALLKGICIQFSAQCASNFSVRSFSDISKKFEEESWEKLKSQLKIKLLREAGISAEC